MIEFYLVPVGENDDFLLAGLCPRTKISSREFSPLNFLIFYLVCSQRVVLGDFLGISVINRLEFIITVTDVSTIITDFW